jgi:hypothetical protein
MSADHGTGKIYCRRVYDVWCARCLNDDDLGQLTRLEAEREARALGWSLKADGWVCPRCYSSATERGERREGENQ